MVFTVFHRKLLKKWVNFFCFWNMIVCGREMLNIQLYSYFCLFHYRCFIRSSAIYMYLQYFYHFYIVECSSSHVCMLRTFILGLKTCVRSTMTGERLCGWAKLHSHRNMAVNRENILRRNDASSDWNIKRFFMDN